jgi:hypothetical protein
LIWIKIERSSAGIVTSTERRPKTRFQEGDQPMPKLKPLHVVIALSVAMPIALADTAFAAKKKAQPLTFEQAWALCKVQVDKLAADQQSQRYSRGAACMHHYGFRI